MRDYTNTVPANDSAEVGRVGNFVHVKETTGDLTFLAEYDGQTFRLVMQRGDVLTMPRKFDSLRVVNDTAGGVTFTLVIGNGDFRREGTITIEKPGTSAAGNVSCLAGASTVIRSAVTSRQKLSISSDVANSALLKIGEAPSALNGIDLFPGETISITFTGVIRAYNAAGLPQQVSFFEEQD